MAALGFRRRLHLLDEALDHGRRQGIAGAFRRAHVDRRRFLGRWRRGRKELRSLRLRGGRHGGRLRLCQRRGDWDSSLRRHSGIGVAVGVGLCIAVGHRGENFGAPSSSAFCCDGFLTIPRLYEFPAIFSSGFKGSTLCGVKKTLKVNTIAALTVSGLPPMIPENTSPKLRYRDREKHFNGQFVNHSPGADEPGCR